jgi:hypothetical protein
MKNEKIQLDYTLKCRYTNSEGKDGVGGVSAYISRRGEVMADFNDSNADIFTSREEAVSRLHDLKSRKFNYSRQVSRDETLITADGLYLEVTDTETGNWIEDIK